MSMPQEAWAPVRQLANILPPGRPGGWTALRAPGRVNLIGDHTDYNGLPVMPFALDREVRILVRPLDEPRVHLLNVDPAFPPRSFTVSGSIEPGEKGDWGNYARAAVQALMVWSHGKGHKPGKGFEACVASSIPSGAGLSSSSALVVGMALAFVHANELKIEPDELAGLMAAGERYVGTQGGGMDQAACLLSRRGHALKIEFGPLRTRPIPIPEDAAIVVANSLVRSEKSAAEKQKYNLRPIEGRIASAIVAAGLGRERATLAELLGDNPDPAQVVREFVPEEPLTTAQVASLLSASPDDLRRTLLATSAGDTVGEPQEGFKPNARAMHALAEAARVSRAADALEAGDLPLVGRLMNESHASLRDLCETSCPELEALVEAAAASGAIGARVTGAGFGGCVVMLARANGADNLIEGVTERYYRGWLQQNRPHLAPDSGRPLDGIIFRAHASEGAGVAPGVL